MFQLPKRPLATFLLVVFLPQALGCHSVHQVEPANIELPTNERIVGLTTIAGREIHFAHTGRATADSAFGTLEGGILYAVPLDSVQRLWVERYDPGRSVLAGLGVLIGVAVIAAAIVAATKESCPFVYSWDGEKYVFDAEPYGGAISQGLERDDYAALEHLKAVDGYYRLLMTNEVPETQMTNLVELWVVSHPSGTRVIPDEQGQLHTIAAPVAPTSAIDQSGRNLLPWLRTTDQTIWEPLAIPDSGGGLQDEIVLTFPKPPGATEGRLIANVATGIWGSHMIRAMTQLRGRETNAWYDQVDHNQASRDSLAFWNLREEVYALRVQLEEPDGWVDAAVLPGGGPFIAEDRVVSLDLGGVRGDSIRIRVRPPRGYWALNSFAVDFGVDLPVQVDTLRPVQATDMREGDILSTLTASDSLYYAMPNTGDRATLSFRAPSDRPGGERTILLHSRGYYRLHLPPGGEPDTAQLQRLALVSGSAAAFAAEQYRHWHLAGAGQ